MPRSQLFLTSPSHRIGVMSLTALCWRGSSFCLQREQTCIVSQSSSFLCLLRDQSGTTFTRHLRTGGRRRLWPHSPLPSLLSHPQTSLVTSPSLALFPRWASLPRLLCFPSRRHLQGSRLSHQTPSIPTFLACCKMANTESVQNLLLFLVDSAEAFE